MQEHLRIDDLKRVEKQVTKLLNLWQKLNIEHNRLVDKYESLGAEMARIKAKHQEEVAQLEQKHSQAEDLAQHTLAEAVRDENQRWQQKYDELRSAHEQQLLELNESNREQISAIEERAQRKEEALKEALAQVNKVKNALSNRVLGIEE